MTPAELAVAVAEASRVEGERIHAEREKWLETVRAWREGAR